MLLRYYYYFILVLFRFFFFFFFFIAIFRECIYDSCLSSKNFILCCISLCIFPWSFHNIFLSSFFLSFLFCFYVFLSLFVSRLHQCYINHIIFSIVRLYNGDFFFCVASSSWYPFTFMITIMTHLHAAGNEE